MSSRYIARRYGTKGLQTKGGGDESRPSSRASMGRNDSASRPPSRGEMISSRPPSRGSMVNGSNYPSRGPSMSRCASPTPSYYASYNGSGGSGRSTPEMGYSPGTGNNSRATTPNQLSNTSRKLRERSIPPPAPLPEKLEYVRGPPLSGRPPPAPARVVASDFYRGKVKSIYEREPLFKDFCQTIPQRYGGQVNIYNTGTLDTIKTDFKAMVEDKWNRAQLKDPSVEMNFGAKVYAWRDMHVKEKVPASARIYREQCARPRATTPTYSPRVYVYHRSTMSPAPA